MHTQVKLIQPPQTFFTKVPLMTSQSLKEIQEFRFPRYQASCFLGILDPTSKATPGPTGLITADYPNNDLKILEPWLSLALHPTVGLYPLDKLSYPLQVAPLTKPLIRGVNISDGHFHATHGQDVLIHIWHAMYKEEPLPFAPYTHDPIIEDWATRTVSTFGDRLPPLDKTKSPRFGVRMPHAPPGTLLFWDSIHGNYNPVIKTTSGKTHVTAAYILDCVKTSDLAKSARASCELEEFTTAWRTTGKGFTVHQGSNHNVDLQDEFQAVRGVTPFKGDPHDILFSSESKSDGPVDASLLITDERRAHLLNRGWLAITPEEMEACGVIGSKTWTDTVHAAASECVDFWAWCIYDRVGVPRPDDLFAPLLGQAEALAATGNRHILNKSKVTKDDDGKETRTFVSSAQFGNLISKFAGMGHSTSLSYSPHLIDMLIGSSFEKPGPIQVAFDQLYREKTFWNADRFRLKALVPKVSKASHFSDHYDVRLEHLIAKSIQATHPIVVAKKKRSPTRAKGTKRPRD